MNGAYNFHLEEQKRHQSADIIKLPSKKERRLQKIKAQRFFLISAFSTFLIAGCGVSFFIFGQVRLTEITDRLTIASKELEECKSVNMALMMKLEAAKSVENANDVLNNIGEDVEVIRVHKEDVARIK